MASNSYTIANQKPPLPIRKWRNEKSAIVSRVLSRMVIYLGNKSPGCSSDGRRLAGHLCPQLSCAKWGLQDD